jgi:hypothetical protein
MWGHWGIECDFASDAINSLIEENRLSGVVGDFDGPSREVLGVATGVIGFVNVGENEEVIFSRLYCVGVGVSEA